MGIFWSQQVFSGILALTFLEVERGGRVIWEGEGQQGWKGQAQWSRVTYFEYCVLSWCMQEFDDLNFKVGQQQPPSPQQQSVSSRQAWSELTLCIFAYVFILLHNRLFFHVVNGGGCTLKRRMPSSCRKLASNQRKAKSIGSIQLKRAAR